MVLTNNKSHTSGWTLAVVCIYLCRKSFKCGRVHSLLSTLRLPRDIAAQLAPELISYQRVVHVDLCSRRAEEPGSDQP